MKNAHTAFHFLRSISLNVYTLYLQLQGNPSVFPAKHYLFDEVTFVSGFISSSKSTICSNSHSIYGAVTHFSLQLLSLLVHLPKQLLLVNPIPTSCQYLVCLMMSFDGRHPKTDGYTITVTPSPFFCTRLIVFGDKCTMQYTEYRAIPVKNTLICAVFCMEKIIISQKWLKKTRLLLQTLGYHGICYKAIKVKQDDSQEIR